MKKEKGNALFTLIGGIAACVVIYTVAMWLLWGIVIVTSLAMAQ